MNLKKKLLKNLKKKKNKERRKDKKKLKPMKDSGTNLAKTSNWV